MLNIFESQQAVRTAFQADEARSPRRSVSLWRVFIGWLGRRRGREHVGDLAPSILFDVGLRDRAPGGPSGLILVRKHHETVDERRVEIGGAFDDLSVLESHRPAVPVLVGCAIPHAALSIPA